MKEREPRISTSVPARVRLGDGWFDVTIMNVSLHGMMLRVANPPRRGSYIEVRRASQVVIGRVVWSKSGQCGIRAQDMIDTMALTGASAIAAPKWTPGDPDRRAAERRTIEHSSAHSQKVARQLQFMAVVAFLILAAGMILQLLKATFDAALSQVTQALL